MSQLNWSKQQKNIVHFEIHSTKDLHEACVKIPKLQSNGALIVFEICAHLSVMLDFATQVRSEGLQTAWEAKDPQEVRMFAFYDETIKLLLKQKKIILKVVDFNKREEAPDKEKELSTLPEFVYVIKAVSQNSVKIGYSKNPEKRLAELLTASPNQLELIAVIPGTMSDEKALHDRFADYRIRKNGEWFELDGAVLQWVRSL